MTEGRVRIVLCAPGKFTSPSELSERFGSDVEISIEDADPEIPEAFRIWSSPLRPTLSKRDLSAIAAHERVVYAVSRDYGTDRAPAVAHSMLKVGSELLDLGAAAIKCESSGISHGPKAWREYALEATQAHERSLKAQGDAEQYELRVRFWIALRDAFVQLPIRAEDHLYSCGMHLLGEPDVAISDAAALAAFGSRDEPACARLLDEFCLYVLAEAEVGAGDTFRRAPGAPAFRVRRENCNEYSDDDLFFNPYGVLWLDAP